MEREKIAANHKVNHQYNDQEYVFADVRNTVFPVPNSFKYQVKPEFMTQLYIIGTRDKCDDRNF